MRYRSLSVGVADGRCLALRAHGAVSCGVT